MAPARKNSELSQSDLDFEKPRKRPQGKLSLIAAGGEFMRWLPLMAMLALLAQVGIRGLRPALAEARDLERKDAELEQHYSAAVEQQQALELRLQAQDDPIYIERMRRLRVRQELGEVDSQ